MSLIYWVGNTKTDFELVLPKHGILSPSVENKLEILASHNIKLVADVLLDEATNLSYNLKVLLVSRGI